MPETRPFAVTYHYLGRRCVIALPAEHQIDAEHRLAALHRTAFVAGEVVPPPPLPSLIERIRSWIHG